MKPDDIKTGSVESAPAAGELAIEQNPNQQISSLVETQPVTASNTLPTPSTEVPTAIDVTGTKVTNDDNKAPSHYESEIAKLPAEDSGPIEKEWIQKADEIVAKTSLDPFSQDEAQHSLSRAYLKKRFNLEIE
ncbi:MAG: hypothetical protein WCK71_00180 [bacterium]